MERPKYLEQIQRLANTYDLKLFPFERIEMIWERFKNYQDYQFSQAVDFIVLHMPPASKVIEVLNEKMAENTQKKYVKTGPVLSVIDCPLPKDIVDKYANEIKQQIRGMPKLPYDPTKRISVDDDDLS